VSEKVVSCVEITEVRISLKEDDKLKAFASVTLDDCFVVRGLKIIAGNGGMFVAMPSRKKPDGTYQDIAHPINNEMRDKLERRVIAEYERAKAEAPQGAVPVGAGASSGQH
jgi:stage V sporulation protein G